MERVYHNSIPGEERIRVEITAAELAPLLRDLRDAVTPEGQRLWRLLDAARQGFEAGRAYLAATDG